MTLPLQFLPFNFNLSQPIPNGPFYSDPTYYVQGVNGPLIIGSGLSVNFFSGTLSATGGGGSGTVTSVDTGTGLTGGPITSSGTISLTNTAVTPDVYVAPIITVDQQGRITAASNPGWVSAGTLQTVGLTSTGGINPVPGSTVRNNVSYRQIGKKQWEIVYTLTANGAWVNGGSGDYLFTLPNGLSFDTTLPWQPIWTGSGGSGSQENRWYWIPGASSIQIGTNGDSSVYGSGVAVYSATQFRAFATSGTNSAPAPVNSAWWGGLPTTNFTIGFQFTST